MKQCDYCGRSNDDAVTACCECGSSLLATRSQPETLGSPRKLEPDETPQGAFAQKDGNVIKLKCRTPEEAYLVSDELENHDIVPILPDDGELYSEYKRNGYVEVRVSAKAYESVADLRPVVEFQHKRLRGEQALPYFGKALAMGCGAFLEPGWLVFAWLLSSYQANGYYRKAKEFKLWFLFGLVAWVLMIVGLIALG